MKTKLAETQENEWKSQVKFQLQNEREQAGKLLQ
jgi:hypothetical protein